jgi:hypothetical protein
MAFTDTQKIKVMEWLGIPYRADKITNVSEQLNLVAASAEAQTDIESILSYMAIIDADQKKVRAVPHIPSYSLNTVELSRLIQQLAVLTGIPAEAQVWNPQALQALVPLSSPAIAPLISLPLFSSYATERGLQISPTSATVKSFQGSVATAAIQMVNTSTVDIIIESITLAGEQTLTLTGLPSLPLTLAANETSTFNVSFDPPNTAAIVYAANAEISITDDSGKIYTIPAVGTVINAAA